MSNDITKTPQWQRFVQKAQRKVPDKNRLAILLRDTYGELVADKFRKDVAGRALKAEQTFRTSQLSLSKRRSDIEFGLGQEAADISRGRRRTGEAISLLGVPVAGYFGREQLGAETALAKARIKNEQRRNAELASMLGG